MKFSPQAFANISISTFTVAVPCGLYFMMGLAVAKSDGLGPFGFLLWPTLILMFIAFATQCVAICGFKSEARAIAE